MIKITIIKYAELIELKERTNKKDTKKNLYIKKK